MAKKLHEIQLRSTRVIIKYCDMKKIENTQLLILDLKGSIIYSDDVLFEVEKLPSKNIFDWSPFIESIFPALLKKVCLLYTSPSPRDRG